MMKRPPRDPKEPIVGRNQWGDIISFGFMITIATLGAFWIALDRLALSPADSAAVAFLTLALSQMWHVFNMRGRDEKMIVNSVTRNPYVYAALIISLLLLAIAFFVPAMSNVMALNPLTGVQLSLACAASLLPLIAGQLWLKLTNAARTTMRPTTK